ncbi:hypothetical protein [Sandaracinus amylolyticus]|nr:hypothetical protein [Sandaracinus amylolyticus]
MTPSRDHLTLGPLTFEIAEASISAQLDDPYWMTKYAPERAPPRVLWFVEVHAKPLVHDGEHWAPAASHAFHSAIRSWRELGEVRLAWTSRFDEETGEPNGNFYVFEHRDIPEASLSIRGSERSDFIVELRGKCDVGGSSEIDENVPFALVAAARFTEIVVHGSGADDAATLTARLAQHVALDELVAGELTRSGKLDDGTPCCRMSFAARR